MELHADRGEKIDTKRFIGAPLYVQFVNPRVQEQTDLAYAVLSDLPTQPMTSLLVTANVRELRDRLPAISNNVIIVSDGYAELRKLFNVPECCEITLIFDRAGKLVDRRYYYQGGVIAQLHSIVDGEAAFSPTMIGTTFNSITKGQFADIRARSLTSSSGTAVVGLFSAACTVCSSGEMVDAINEQAKHQAGIEFLILLPKTFSSADVSNFKSNLEVRVPIAVADDEVSKIWEPLIAKYGQRNVNGVLLLVNKGNISVVTGVDQLKNSLMKVTSSDAKL